MLQKAITGLPDKYREVFILRDVEELNNFETAAALSITVGNVKVRLHRARLMLQKQLAPAAEKYAIPRGDGSHGFKLQTCLGLHLRVSGRHFAGGDARACAKAP